MLNHRLIRVASRFYGAALLIALAAAMLLLPANVRTPLPEWLLFFGRLHPVVLHVPIGLFVLLPVLHVLARLCHPGSLRPAIIAVGWLCAGSTVAATICGLLLSQESGYAGATLGLHRQYAFLLSGLSILLLLCESEGKNPLIAGARLARSARVTYCLLFPCALASLGVAAHLGGDLTHGATFLTEHLPAAWKPVPIAPAKPIASAAGAPESEYARAIAPILEARCVSCHGAEKSKGGLRLHSIAAIREGGDSQREEHKASVVPGHADASLLIQTIDMPEDDDAHMPPAGKAQLTPAEIATLRSWIDAGADGLAPVDNAPAEPGPGGSS